MTVALLLIQRPFAASLLDLLGAPRAVELERVLLGRALAWGQTFAPVHTYQTGCAPDELAQAGAAAFERSEGGPLLLASTACATLSSEHRIAALADAAHGLDISIGPAADGGWYLLALGKAQPELLAAAGVGLGEALLAVRQAGLAVGLLRSERELLSAAAARALCVDPIVPIEIRSILQQP